MKKQLNSLKNPEQIEFPVISRSIAPSSIRSLDEIDAWIEEDYRLFFNRKQYEEEKVKHTVYEAFRLEADKP
jgi:hypothetical protein